MVVTFISSAPSNSTACHFVNLDIIANYHVKMAISSIISEQLQGEVKCIQGCSQEFQKGVSNNRMNMKLGSDSPRC